MKKLLLALIMILIAPIVVLAQSAAVSKILDPFYPSSCGDPSMITEIKWGISLIAVPLPSPIVEIHPTQNYMGSKDTINNDPVEKRKYSDMRSCVVSGKLSDGETINGIYSQWRSIADTDKSLDKKSNKVGTHIDFGGIIYDSHKYTLKQAMKNGSVFRNGESQLFFIFPGGKKISCFSQYMDCGDK